MAEVERFDAAVIGAGAGGMTVAVGLAAFGRRVALIEAARVGGDCTNVGCIPSKRLLHLAREPGARHDARSILADVRRTRDALEARERDEFGAMDGITLIAGHATIVGPRSVRVRAADGVRRLLTRDIVVATGGRPRSLDIPGLSDRALTNESLFELEQPPGHLVIVGAGAVGLEMADAFARLGSRVTIVEAADRPLAVAGDAAAAAIAAALARRGIALRTGSTVTGFDGATRTLRLSGPRGEGMLGDVDRVLVAVGRVPATRGLGLERVGVLPAPEGIPVDAWGRTGAEGVWAVGDVTPGSHQTHAANAMGRRIVRRIALPLLPALGGPPPIPSAVFTDPEVAWIGPREHALARRIHPDATTTIGIGLPDTDRGLTDGVTIGFVEITAVRLTGRILAATAVGPTASETITTIALAMRRRISLHGLRGLVVPYPTFSGAITAIADEFARRTLPALPREAGRYARHRLARPPRP